MILQTPLHILKFIRLILLSYSLSLNLWTETLICTRNWDPALVTNVQWEIRSLNLQNYMSCKNYIGLFQNRILSLNTVNCPYNQHNKIEKEKKATMSTNSYSYFDYGESCHNLKLRYVSAVSQFWIYLTLSICRRYKIRRPSALSMEFL